MTPKKQRKLLPCSDVSSLRARWLISCCQPQAFHTENLSPEKAGCQGYSYKGL